MLGESRYAALPGKRSCPHGIKTVMIENDGPGWLLYWVSRCLVGKLEAAWALNTEMLSDYVEAQMVGVEVNSGARCWRRQGGFRLNDR